MTPCFLICIKADTCFPSRHQVRWTSAGLPGFASQAKPHSLGEEGIGLPHTSVQTEGAFQAGGFVGNLRGMGEMGARGCHRPQHAGRELHGPGEIGGGGITCCSTLAVNCMAWWCCSSSMSMCRWSRKSFRSSSIQPSSSCGEGAANVGLRQGSFCFHFIYFLKEDTNLGKKISGAPSGGHENTVCPLFGSTSEN